MSFQNARKILNDGGCVYRRKWDSDKFLTTSRNRIVLVQKHKVKGMYIFTAEDLSARDWMQEHFAVPTAAR